MLAVVNKLSILTTYAPIVTAVPATRDAWVSAWLAALLSALIALISYSLLLRFPGQTIFVIARQVLGPSPGRLFNVALSGLLLYFAGNAIRAFAEVFVTAMVPDTPVVTLNVMMAALALLGALGGIAVLTRLSEMVGPIMILSFLVIVGLTSPQIHVERLLPVFEYGPEPMVLQAVTPIAVFGEVGWTVFLVMPYLREPRQAKKAILAATAISGFMVSLGAALLIATMGPHLIDRELFPTLTIARAVELAEFLTRIEWIVASLWMGSMQVKIALLLYGAIGALRDALGQHKGWPIPVAVSVAAVAWAELGFEGPKDVMASFDPATALPLALLLVVVMPGLLLLVSLVRGKRLSPSGKAANHG